MQVQLSKQQIQIILTALNEVPVKGEKSLIFILELIRYLKEKLDG